MKAFAAYSVAVLAAMYIVPYTLLRGCRGAEILAFYSLLSLAYIASALAYLWRSWRR